MTDEQALIDACLAASEDDLPKLVLADWLEDQGRGTEAWRIRQYLHTYRDRWHAAIRWNDRPRVSFRDVLRGGKRDDREVERVREQVVHQHPLLWRLACLTLLDATAERYPQVTEHVPWAIDGTDQGTDGGAALRPFCEVRCRILLYACTAAVPLDDWVVPLAPTRARKLESVQANRGWAMLLSRNELALYERIAELYQVFDQEGCADLAGEISGMIGWMLHFLVGESGQRSFWSAERSLWTHIRNTSPAW